MIDLLIIIKQKAKILNNLFFKILSANVFLIIVFETKNTTSLHFL